MSFKRAIIQRAGRVTRLAAALGFSCALIWTALPASLRRMVVPGAEAANFVVSNTHDAGAGSLRAAILAANASGGKDTIQFQLGPGAKTIKPLTPLPEVTDPLVIDATTQPGYLNVPVVELDGSAAGLKAVGLRISAGGSTVKGLVINRFKGPGVWLTGGGQNVIQGNFIGADAAGSAAAGNANGVWIDGGSGNNLVGGVTAQERNVISGNAGDGVHVEDSSPGNNKIRLNYIGVDRDGAAAVPNGSAGVRLLSAGNTVGGEGSFTGDASLQGNVISGNARGVVISGATAKNNIVRGNTVGLDATGKKTLGNANAGVEVFSANNKVGGSVKTDGNIISGNAGDGLLLSGETCQNTAVQNNLIGPGKDNLYGVGNLGAGVRLADAPNNTVGGLYEQTGNLISFNKGAAVSIQGAKAAGNKVQGNRLGPLPEDGGGNLGPGVEIVGAPNNTVGGTQEAQRNFITGNTGYGVDIRGGSAGNAVQGNHFGMHDCYCAVVGNGLAAVRIAGSSNNTVGGTQPGARNVVTEGESGVLIEDGSTANTVAGNYLGLLADGHTFIKQGYGYGVRLLRSSGNVVGGSAAGARNVIAGFERGGVRVEGPAAFGNKIQGNYIGTNADGANGTPLAGGGPTNGYGGVYILGAFDTLVGGTGTGEGNLIAGNGSAGVAVESGTGNAIFGNSIHSNEPKEIDLAPIFYSANDPLDADRGANERQNHPVIKSAAQQNINLQIKGSLDSAPGRQYRVEYFGGGECGPYGQGGGKKFLGSSAVATGADGHADINATIVAFNPGDFVTATATDPDGNTSEFSPCVATGSPQPGVLQFANYGYYTKETAGKVTVSVMRSVGLAGKVTVAYTTVDPDPGQQGAATPGQDYTKTSGTLVFEDGEFLKSFDIPITSDGLLQEDDEGISLQLSNPTGGATLGAYENAFVTLFNNTLTKPAVVVADAVVSEGDSGVKQAALNVHVDSHTGPVTVTYYTQDGTATEGEDYTALPAGPAQKLDFAPGETDKSILVDIKGDAKLEKDEVIIVVFQVFGGYAFNEFGNRHRQVVITNDDAAPPAFAFDAASLSTAENASTATLNVTRTGSAAGVASVNYATSDLTAKAGSDYAAASGTLNFAPGETSKAVTVQLTNDTTYEALEEFEVKLSDPSAGATLGAPSSAQVHVVDDDPAPSLSVSDPSLFEGNAGTSDAVFAVTLSAPSGVEVNVNYAAANLLVPNAALAGEDYAQAQGALTFAPGETSKQVVVKISGDTEVEQDETFTLALSNSDAATLAKSKGYCTIKNDDAPPAQKPSVSISNATVAEGDEGTADALFNVTLSSPSAQTVSVPFETADVQALNAAKAGSDYQHASGVVTFAPGETSKTLAVTVYGDTEFESNESFAVSLSAPAGGGADLADGFGLCVITNDDPEPTPTPTPEPTPTPKPEPKPAANTFQFEQAVYAAQEESSHVTLTVTREGDLSSEASVDYETLAGTADDRGEFTTTLGTLRFAAGEGKKNFDLLLTEDSYAESEVEQAQVLLSNPSEGFALGPRAAATVSITDDPSEAAANTIDDAEHFVRQHYHDFLGREADPQGLAFWTGELLACGSDEGCLEAKRQHVSAAFFLSIEFQETGFLVHRLYRASFNRLARYREFVRDTQEIGRGVVVNSPGWEAQLEANKAAFLNEFAARADFQALYGGMTNAQYVDALNADAAGSLSQAERDTLVAGLDASTETRATVLRKIADDPDFRARETSPAFVLMQYYGYLRRNPDDAPDADFAGYNFWLGKLNEFGGDYRRAEMVRAFLVSNEYRKRFGQ